MTLPKITQGTWDTSLQEVLDAANWVKENPPDGVAVGSYTRVYPLNDRGNAQRFAEKFTHLCRFNHDTNEWYRWNGIIWKVCEKAEVQEDAKVIADDIARDAKQVAFDLNVARDRSHPDHWKQEWRREMLAWAKQSGMEPHIKKMMKLANSIEPIGVVSKDFDADRVLLAFPNGYLNLKTGEFIRPDPTKLVTKVTAAPRVPEAQSELWERTFARFQPEAEVRRDLETAWGYGLSGRGKEHAFIAEGPTRSGKSTLIQAVKNALGDYATDVGLETLTTDRQQHGGGSREDLVALLGKRMAVGSEATEYQRINAAMLKRLLGGSDEISMRANYGKQFKALPTFALWLYTDEMPRLTAEDDAVWERVHVFAFDNQIPAKERDETERDKVVDPAITGSAILWALEQGWWRFVREQKGRLSLPTTEKRTKAYRQEQDHVARFIAEHCVTGKGHRVSVSRFREEFKRWLEKEHISEAYSDRRIGLVLNRQKHEDGSLRFPESTQRKEDKGSERIRLNLDVVFAWN